MPWTASPRRRKPTRCLTASGGKGRSATRAAADSTGLAAGTTLALTVSEGVKQGFRVAADLTARPWSHAETARLAQWEPSVPATALPPDINRRVNAALTPTGRRPETAPTPPEPPKRITANVRARCIARELGQLRLGQRAANDLRRTERLRAAFASELPTSVNDRIGQLRRDGVSGTALSEALAELETPTRAIQLAAGQHHPGDSRPW